MARPLKRCAPKGERPMAKTNAKAARSNKSPKLNVARHPHGPATRIQSPRKHDRHHRSPISRLCPHNDQRRDDKGPGRPGDRSSVAEEGNVWGRPGLGGAVEVPGFREPPL